MRGKSLAFVANHGSLGGGEIMVLRMAEVAAQNGIRTVVVGPSAPAELMEATLAKGLSFREAGSGSRLGRVMSTAEAIAALHVDLVWSAGLWPALAAFMARSRQVIHLHQEPAPLHRPFALVRRAADLTVVPSQFMGARLPGSIVLKNWTNDLGGTFAKAASSKVVRLGFAGRLSMIKGVDVLAASADLLADRRGADIRVVLAGDGRFVPRGVRRKVDAALSRSRAEVKRLGWVSPTMLYGQVDAIVVPSRWEEPFGLVAAEAMSAGIPLVVSNAGALPEVVGSDHPWIFERGSAAHLATILSEMFSSPGKLAQSVSDARRRWETEFSPTAGSKRFLELLQCLFNNIGSGSLRR